MASVCNAWKNQPTKWTRTLFWWFVLFLTVKKRWLAMCNKNLHECGHISIPVPLHFEHLFNWKISQSWRWIQDWKFQQILFLSTWKVIKLAKNKTIKIKENLNETDHVSDLCKNASGKINGLPRVAPYMSISKCRILMNTFFKSQCKYCPLVWMRHSWINQCWIQTFFGHNLFLKLKMG